MAEFDNMRKSLPVAYRTDKWVCDLLAAIQSLDDTQREQMFDITQQLFPGSMTWALAIEERDAGLASTGTLEERAVFAACIYLRAARRGRRALR